MNALYFAYGSNLKRARMRERVTSARVLAAARLDGFELRLDKRGRDGSGKANLAPAPGSWVWGVVYRLDPAQWPALDACEPGYIRMPVRVQSEGGSWDAETYRSQLLSERPTPFAWYKRLIVEGAREQGLPAEWVAGLEALPELPDPPELS